MKAVEQTTTTPSGNVSYMWNGTSTTSYSFAFSSCSYSRSEPLHRHWLQKDDETQSRSEHFAQTVSFDCGGGFTQTCTTSYELHSANGAVQFQRGEFVCTTP